jgi:hypothetical protein
VTESISWLASHTEDLSISVKNTGVGRVGDEDGRFGEPACVLRLWLICTVHGIFGDGADNSAVGGADRLFVVIEKL